MTVLTPIVDMDESVHGMEQAELSRAGDTLLLLSRKEKRKALKKMKRKRMRKQVALTEIEEDEKRLNDPNEQEHIRAKEQEEAVARERELKMFEEREKAWLEEAAKRKEKEEERRRTLDEVTSIQKAREDTESDEDDDEDYINEGPAEIIWQGNEILVKKKRIRASRKALAEQPDKQGCDRPTSNPLPPESMAFGDYGHPSSVPSQQTFESVAQHVPNFGTEQDKSHCPFHIKTGACRFGTRCSRVHLYPDVSCTLLMKNMYNGPGLPWEQDEGLETPMAT